MTDNVELSDCEKTIMNADEPIYGDLITEIDLHVVEDSTTDDKVKESLTDLVVEPSTVVEIIENNPEIPTEPETYANADILPQDDTVSEFFTVDSKPDEFENDMLIGELDNEGIDFKNDTDIAECHHEYESKKLLFGDCEDIVEVVNNDEQTEIVEDVQEPDTEVEVIVATETEEVEENIIEQSDKIIVEDQDNVETSFVEAEEEESLNRMHVMEDVEEGCDVSGALPSSPGHAEQRPDPPKPEISCVVEESADVETKLPAEVSVPKENGLSTEDEETPKKPTEEKQNPSDKDEKPESEIVTIKVDPKQVKEKESEVKKDDEKMIQLDIKAKESLDIEDTTNKSNEDVTKDSSKRDEEYSSGSESSRGSQTSSTSKRKRTDDEESTAPTKKLRTQIQKQYANHDRILSDYIEASNLNTAEELQGHTEQLLAEIRTLNELAREKEREWNNILHLKKVKEELLLRMQRKKQIVLMNSGDKDWDISLEQDALTKDGVAGGKSLMMVPVVSSSPSPSVTNRTNCKPDKMYNLNNNSKTRNILPKHTNTTTIADLNGQEGRQGRQGPILDVRSIIADYRQRHPETVPRRGRRMKSVLNTNADGKAGGVAGNVLSMASLALGSGSQMRHNSSDVSTELGFLLSTMDSMRQENSRSSNSDSSSMLGNEAAAAAAAMPFKDVLVQFARLSQSERQELQAQAAASLAASSKPPPPPYPEVTLHPVPSAQVVPQTAAVTQHQNQNQNNSNSLLHGILTKTQPRAENKPTTFSPTLARLLTAPERVSNNSAQAMYTAALNSGVSISDLLSTGKSRNEITITPVGQYGQNIKHKDGEHFEEEEAEDSADRLVIDEGSELASTDRNRATDNGSEGGDDVPQCQGCHQKSAQFVCAGCGNQWYCSRDCQVAAWDEHSEVCSG